MKLQEYPILFQKSDSSAIQAQKNHFRIIEGKIVVLLVIALITSFAWNQLSGLRTPVAIGLAIFLVVSIVLGAIMSTRKFDRIWFNLRTIAESVKIESWKFMMKVEPYDVAVPNSEAENRFLNRLDEILQGQPSVCSELTPCLQEDTQITKHMRKMRNETLKNRRSYYVKNRIRDQRLWYANKAKFNKNKESKWFYITWILQLVVAAFAIIIISSSDMIMNPVGILTTAGAGALSWIHARSYRELSQSYGLVAQNLLRLEGQANQASTEKKLTGIVLDAERTISQEHTVWLTRRL